MDLAYQATSCTENIVIRSLNEKLLTVLVYLAYQATSCTENIVIRSLNDVAVRGYQVNTEVADSASWSSIERYILH